MKKREGGGLWNFIISVKILHKLLHGGLTISKCVDNINFVSP